MGGVDLSLNRDSWWMPSPARKEKSESGDG
jgi:hypothetical protein